MEIAGIHKGADDLLVLPLKECQLAIPRSITENFSFSPPPRNLNLIDDEGFGSESKARENFSVRFEVLSFPQTSFP
jgi:hypothetical protein